MFNLVKDGKYEEPAWLTIESRRLIKSMLQIDPKKRICIDELLHHPWVMRGFREPVSINNSCHVSAITCLFVFMEKILFWLFYCACFKNSVFLPCIVFVLDEREGPSMHKFVSKT